MQKPSDSIIRTYITCVNYADMLSLSLPTTKWLSPTIITSIEDRKTQKIAEENNCPVHISNKWGKAFNKTAALNEILDTSSWVLLIDADILLPGPFDLPKDKKSLYGAKARHCEKEKDFGKAWDHYPHRLSVYPQLPHNRPALAGFFHLWWGPEMPGALPVSQNKNASHYDIAHSLRFSNVQLLLNYEVLHLGETDTNWSGRITEKWSIDNV